MRSRVTVRPAMFPVLVVSFLLTLIGPRSVNVNDADAEDLKEEATETEKLHQAQQMRSEPDDEEAGRSMPQQQ